MGLLSSVVAVLVTRLRRLPVSTSFAFTSPGRLAHSSPSPLPQLSATCTAGTHHFCRECVRNYIADRVGNRQYQLDCMSVDGCDATLVGSDVRKFITPNTARLLDKIQQEREIEMAGLDQLERCPFCVEYAVVIENPDERLLVCELDGCRKTSCRLCKKVSAVHLSVSCSLPAIVWIVADFVWSYRCAGRTPRHVLRRLRQAGEPPEPARRRG